MYATLGNGLITVGAYILYMKKTGEDKNKNNLLVMKE